MQNRPFILLLFFMAVLVLPATGYTQSIPDVDWPSVLATADPHLTTEGPCPALPGGDRSICVFVNTTDQGWLTRVFQVPENTPAGGKPDLMGWAMLDKVTYGDIAGDGQTDAVVEVDSGGTAGIAGFFVYRLTDSTPQLLDGRAGFALEAYIDPNAHALYLLGTAPPAPYHPRNAAAGVWRETYTLVGDRLVEQGSCTYIPMAEDVHVPQGQCVP